MAGSYLEVFRFGVYAAFTALSMYLFVDPARFEKWAMNPKAGDTFPPDPTSHPPEIAREIADYRSRRLAGGGGDDDGPAGGVPTNPSKDATAKKATTERKEAEEGKAK